MRALIAFIALTLVLTACNDANVNGDADSGAAGSDNDSKTAQSDNSETTGSTAGDDQAGENVDAYSVADAGGVEFEFDGEQLTLVQAYPNSGWSHSVEVDEDDQIEVDFYADERDVEFEAEIEDERLVLEVINNYHDVGENSFTVVNAGVIELEIDGEELSLEEVNPNEGWIHSVDDDDDERIVVEFRKQGDDTVGIRFEAERDDGDLEVTTVTREYR